MSLADYRIRYSAVFQLSVSVFIFCPIADTINSLEIIVPNSRFWINKKKVKGTRFCIQDVVEWKFKVAENGNTQNCTWVNYN